MSGRREPRIGIIANSFVPGRGALSGGFIHVLNVAAAWSRYEIVVFAPEDARAAVRARLPAARFVAARPRRLPRVLRSVPIVTLAIRLFGTFLVRRQIAACDAVISSTSFLSDVVPMFFARRGRSALIIQHLQLPPLMRAGGIFGNVTAFLTEAIGLAIAGRLARLVFVNDRRVAVRAGISDRAAIEVITHGVDHVPYLGSTTLAERTGAVFVGRLHPTKGLQELLEAWRIVCEALPGTRLDIIGTGAPDFRRKLERLCAALGVEGVVRFRGAVDNAEKVDALHASRVFVFPSHEEGWGIAIAEAMRAATPCVTYDLEAYEGAFTQGRSVVRRHDVEGLARATLRLLTDDDTWQRLSSEASALAATFTWRRAAAIYEAAFDRLIAAGE